MTTSRACLRLASAAGLAAFLTGCYATSTPVIRKGERLPFEGEVTCSVEQPSGPPTVMTLDMGKSLVEDGDGVRYANGDRTLRARKAPSGLWLVQYGRPGRHDVGYLKVEGGQAQVLALSSVAVDGRDLLAHRVRAAEAGPAVELKGDPADVEAFLLDRKPEQLHAAGTCRSGKAVGDDPPIMGPIRRSTTRAQAMAMPGARECDGNVCFREETPAGTAEVEAKFGLRDVLRTLSFRIVSDDLAPKKAAAVDTKPDAKGGSGGMPAFQGMQVIGIVVDGNAAYMADPGTVDPGLYQRIMNIARFPGGSFPGALRQKAFRRVDFVMIDSGSRTRVPPARDIGAYVQAAEQAGGLSVSFAMTLDPQGRTVVQGAASQVRAR